MAHLAPLQRCTTPFNGINMNTSYVLYLPGRNFEPAAMPFFRIELSGQPAKPRLQAGGNFATSPASFDALASMHLDATSGLRRVQGLRVSRALH